MSAPHPAPRPANAAAAAMLPLCEPDLSGNEARYLQACIDSGYVSSVGAFVTRFEAMVAAAAGSSGAVATASGTVGLHLALTAAGVGRDDLVLLPALTFIASANAISQCGATPWLADIEAAGWGLDPALLDRVLDGETRRDAAGVLRRTTCGRRVAAVMPVHCLGSPAEMDGIAAAAARFRLPVIADAAAALGATFHGRPIGQAGALLSVISFNGNKTATCGGGGAVIGDDKALLDLARHLSSTARVGRDYDHDRAGFNYRMTNLQAAVGCAQLERLDSLVGAKRRIARRYDQALAELPGIGRLPRPPWGDSACWLAGLLLPPGRADDLPRLRQALAEDGIEARAFWKPIHLQAPYRDAPATPMPVAESLWDRVVTLPCSTHLAAADQERVIAAVRRAWPR